MLKQEEKEISDFLFYCLECHLYSGQFSPGKHAISDIRFNFT